MHPVIAQHRPGIAAICLRPTSPDAPARRYSIPLSHGSLLCMRGQTQGLWEHAIQKELRVKDPRINLTFRKINGV